MLFFVFFLSPYLPVHLPPSTDVECGFFLQTWRQVCLRCSQLRHVAMDVAPKQMFGVATDVGMQVGMKRGRHENCQYLYICPIHPPPPPPNSISLWSNTLDHSEIPVHFNVSKVLFSFQKWCSSGWTCIMAALKCSPECEYSPCWPQQKMQCAVSDHTVVLFMFFFYMLYHNELDV